MKQAKTERQRFQRIEAVIICYSWRGVSCPPKVSFIQQIFNLNIYAGLSVKKHESCQAKVYNPTTSLCIDMLHYIYLFIYLYIYMSI